MLRRILFMAVFLFFGYAQAMDFEESQAVAKVFKKANTDGTFVLYDVSQKRLIGYNQQRAQTRFIPASTFKIPNSLFGLETKVVSDVDEVFYHHDGKPKYLSSWERDMNLRDAIKVSNVVAYQQLARSIGLNRMQENINKLNYGNRDIGNTVDIFWLEGPLKISAIEQTIFLAKLAQQQLPYNKKNQMQVRDIIKQEAGVNWVLYAKTGWTGRVEPKVGWYVGWVEQNNKIYSFAVNIDTPLTGPISDTRVASMLKSRIDIAKASLQALGLLDSEDKKTDM